jgi:hypothetical protein
MVEKNLRKQYDFSMVWNPLVDVRPFLVSLWNGTPRRPILDFSFGIQPSKEPLVDKTPSILPSIATASRKARAKALKIASAMWWVFVP